MKHISPTRCVPASILEGKATFQSRAYITMVKGNWSNYILRDMRWDWVETKHRSLENLTSLSWLPLILNDISDKLFPNRRRALQLIEVGGPGFTSTRLARYTSAFTTVFYGIARAGLNGSLYKTTYEPPSRNEREKSSEGY